MISFQREERLGDGSEVEEAWEQLRLRWHTLTPDNGEDGSLGINLFYCDRNIFVKLYYAKWWFWYLMIDADEISVVIAQ